MVAVTVARRAAEAAGQHVWPEDADCADDVTECNVVTVPFIEGFFRCFGVAEIHDMAEALLHAVVLVRLEKFERAQDSQLVGSLCSELVLPAFAASDRKQQHARA